MREPTLLTAVALVLIAGPLLLGVAGMMSARPATEGGSRARAPWNWRLSIVAGLLYAIAFNLTFFIQELFLVLPKALVPGLHPTLFHNNHRWEGSNPLAYLFQGTGALAIVATGTVCALLLRYARTRSITVRLFLIWMTYHGFFLSLPQVVVAAFLPGNDVGLALDYLHVGATGKSVLALFALGAMPLIALSLRRPILSLATHTRQLDGGAARSLFLFQTATAPALAAILLIIPFRIPRDMIEVVVLPVVVTVIGIAWLQAGAWRVSGVKANQQYTVPLAGPAIGLLLLLMVFQLVLRPGIQFF